uniref:AN1-type domain-containing protein n=1 Tax=Hyaloperonospora arabidopsidis (strain Emoy2) TaxID=559515 RepID=M4BH13_HYAAE
MDIGAHCSISSCHQQDFLPFTCDCCRSVFCLDHRSYGSHQCPSAGSHDRRVIQCPVCSQLIHWTAEQDVNIVWDTHVRKGQCARQELQQQQTKRQEMQHKKKKKKRCAAPDCREVLLASNQFSCRKCSQDVCLRHRFESDHACASVQQASRQQWLGRFETPKASFATRTKRTLPPQLPMSAQQTAASVVKGTKLAVSSLVQSVKTAASSTAVTTTSEVCPICRQQFHDVSQLVAHVDRVHSDMTGQTRASSATPSESAVSTKTPLVEREVCPQCRADFPTVAALIQHAETAHSSAVAATGRGHDQEKCNIM